MAAQLGPLLLSRPTHKGMSEQQAEGGGCGHPSCPFQGRVGSADSQPVPIKASQAEMKRIAQPGTAKISKAPS